MLYVNYVSFVIEAKTVLFLRKFILFRICFENICLFLLQTASSNK